MAARFVDVITFFLYRWAYTTGGVVVVGWWGGGGGWGAGISGSLRYAALAFLGLLYCSESWAHFQSQFAVGLRGRVIWLICKHNTKQYLLTSVCVYLLSGEIIVVSATYRFEKTKK